MYSIYVHRTLIHLYVCRTVIHENIRNVRRSVKTCKDICVNSTVIKCKNTCIRVNRTFYSYMLTYKRKSYGYK